jgi:hypothetical protein
MVWVPQSRLAVRVSRFLQGYGIGRKTAVLVCIALQFHFRNLIGDLS